MTYPFKEESDLLSPPYSELDQDKYNFEKSLREVYCQNCKYRIKTSLYGVKCGQCKSFLIEMPRLSNV